MTIEKAILSAKEPKEANTAWVQPKGDSLQLNIFNNGKWRPIAGGGSSDSSDSSGCGCEDVIIKGIEEGNSANYTVEKGDFEEVYTGILSGKMYSFKIFEFILEPVLPGAELPFVSYSVSSITQRSNYSVRANTSKPVIEIAFSDGTAYNWTPEKITKKEGGLT